MHSSTSPACQPAFKRRTRAPFSEPDRRPAGIDIAWPLPAMIRLMEPAPQRPIADGNALLRVQVVRQQRHRPARGLVAATARVTCQHRSQPPRREPTALPRPATPRPIHECGRIPPCAILPQPAVHTGAVDMAAAGSLGHRLPLGNQQQRLHSAIHTRLTGSLQSCGKPPAIHTAQSHPKAPIVSVHASERHTQPWCCKTYGYLLSGQHQGLLV